MKNQKKYTFSINMTLSDDMKVCKCKRAVSVPNEIILASMLAGAVVAIAQGRSSDPHKFAEAVCSTIMDRIDKPDITTPSQQLS